MPDEKNEKPEEEVKQPQETKPKLPKKKRSVFRRIVNWFLYIFLGIFIILLIAFAITQTSTFRDYLRDTVVELANENLNGHVSIGKIEGTIFTSLILRNTVVNMGADTLLNAQTIEVKTSPLQLLLKKIKVRYFEIKKTDIALIEDSTGTLNIINLFPPSEEDTTAAGEFPFKIEVSQFKLTNVNFSLQRYDYAASTAFYDSLNMNDLRIKNLNLDLYAFANISKNEYELELNHLSLHPNMNNVSIENLTGDFAVGEDEITVNDLELKSGNSEVNISAVVNNYNVFDTTGVSKLEDAKIKLSMESGQLSFNDVIPFVPSLKDMHGQIATDIELEGTLNNIALDKIEINYLNTQLAARGTIKNLMDPDAMYINAEFYDTYVNPDDIMKLMPSLDIPGYKEIGLLRFDTLTYKGSPSIFNANLLLRTDKGTIAANADLNFSNPKMGYNVRLQTRNLDISPFAGISSNLNLKGTIEGQGTEPENMNAEINLSADGSVVDGNKIDTFTLIADAQNKLITYSLLTTSDSMGVNLDGDINFTNSDNPAYTLNGDVRNLNIGAFGGDSSMQSNLNITLEATGENFDPELMNLYLSLTLFNSTIDQIPIDSTRAIVDLRRDDGGKRVINFISDIADISLTGNFSVPKTIEMMRSEADVITTIMNNKLNEVVPSMMTETNISTATIKKETVKNLVEYTDSLTSISYLVDLKSMDLLSLFMGENRIEIDGDITGEINNTGDSISVTLNSAVEFVKYWGGDDIFFLSNLNLDMSLSNEMNASSLNDIRSSLSLTTDRIFAGTDIRDLSLNMNLENESAQIDFSTQIEDYANTKITGKFDLSGSNLALLLDTLRLTYNNYTLTNDSIINLTYSESGIDFESFVLSRNGGNISVNGTLRQKGNQDLNISINNLRVSDLAANLMKQPENDVDALINMDTKITGSFAEPLIDLKLSIDSLNYQSRGFGSFTADLNYKNKNLDLDLKFLDSIITANQPAFYVKGNVPIDLGFTGVEERFSENGQMNVALKADNFDLSAFGDLLPFVNKLRGKMAADLTVTGSPNNPDPEGYIRLDNAAFIVEMNNLEYNAGLKLSVTKESLTIDTLVIKNSEGTEGGGTMFGSGKAQLDNFNITSSNFSINGDLKVLDDISKSGSPSAYGTLIIGTRGNVEFTLDENGANLTAPITIKEANLTFPPTQGAYKNTNSSFIYKFVEDTAAVLVDGPNFETLVSMSRERSAGLNSSAAKPSTFNFSIDVEIEDEATIIFVLSKELNQNLTAVLSGNIVYESIEGRSKAQGELTLLDGSTLEFIKTLDADGSVRFESDLTNPYLDITATYLDYFYAGTSSTESTGGANGEVPVAVKIKVKGYLNDLGKNFIQEEDNIAVYYGQDEIENNTPDSRFDKSDAVYFMLTGNFVNSTSQGSNTSFASSQATSIAGSVLSGFLSKNSGGYVKSVELRQVGTQTVFNLSGRVNKFRYSIGGTNETFQDIGRANVKIEYPVIEDLLLRLERKQSYNETNNVNEMINELGLRYKFEF